MNEPKVTVVVVSYNTKEKLRQCIEAIEPEHEIIVIDNASTDGSPEMVRNNFPAVKLIQNQENRGFGAANNQGIEEARGELILLLNSDAYAHPGAITRLAEVFCDTSVVAAGGRLLNPNGTLQQSSANELSLWVVFCEQFLLEKLFPNSKLFSPYWNSSRFDHTSHVDQVMGACLMMLPVARFDERYFLYCEDTDLCIRLSKLGQIFYVPQAKFTHDLGSSSSSDRWKSVARYNRGKELYFSIHRSNAAATMCWILDRKGAALRMIGWGLLTLLTLGLRKRYVSQTRLFARVLFCPLLGPDEPRSPQAS